MDINITLALILAVLVMFYITMKFIKSIFWKIKRNIFSGYGLLKLLGLTGAISTANYQVVTQTMDHFLK